MRNVEFDTLIRPLFETKELKKNDGSSITQKNEDFAK